MDGRSDLEDIEGIKGHTPRVSPEDALTPEDDEVLRVAEGKLIVVRRKARELFSRLLVRYNGRDHL